MTYKTYIESQSHTPHSVTYPQNIKKGRKEFPFSPFISIVRFHRVYPSDEIARLNGRNIFRKAAWRVNP